MGFIFKVLKFALVGVLNTGVTYLFYLLLLNILPYTTSYLVSYVLGIFFSFVLNSKFVFNSKITLAKFLKYPVVYIVQFLLNWVFLFVLVDKLSIEEKIAPLLVTVISIPITFLLTRYILTDSKINLRKTKGGEI